MTSVLLFPRYQDLNDVLTRAIGKQGASRMGPTFGAMMASGVKAAKTAIALLDRLEVEEGEVVGWKKDAWKLDA